MRRIFYYPALLILLLFSFSAASQIGGDNTYDFLNLPNSARIAALGGDFLALKDDDITLAIANPSIIDKSLHKHLSLSITDHFADVTYGFAAYSHTFNKVGSFVASMQFIDYGRFLEADDFGNTYGNFHASEYALSFGWGRQLSPHWLIGANLKVIYSSLENYNSTGLAVDIAGSYYHEKANFITTLLVRNAGRQLDAYTPGNREPLPFRIDLGFSKGFSHAPIRISLLGTHLEKWDLTWHDPANADPVVDPLTGDSLPEKKFSKWVDKLMRHVVVGGEFHVKDNFFIRVGYNYQRRSELRVEGRKGIIGFTMGVGIRIKMFHFDYSWSKYHLSGAPNTFTITTNISAFGKRSKDK